MALSTPYNLVRFFTATTGTSDPVVGAAVPGFVTPAQAGVPNGKVVTYTIVGNGITEEGQGTYSTTGPTLARTTVRRSTAGGSFNSKITLLGGEQVTLSWGAEDMIQADATGAILVSCLDVLLTARGDIIRKGSSNSERLALGAAGSILSSDGTDALYRTLTSLFDTGFATAARGDIVRRGATVWDRYALGASGKSLVSDGTDVGYGFPAPHTLDNGGFGGYTTTSTSALMAGLGAGGAFTPSRSGKHLAILQVLYLSQGAANQVSLSFNYGTSTPPTTGAASTGTAISASAPLFAGGEYEWATYMGLITLTVGTPYWFDFSLQKVSGSAAVVNNSHLLILEF